MRTLAIWLGLIFVSNSIDDVAKAIDRNTEAVKAAHGTMEKK